MNITHLNPDTLYKNPVFSQAVIVEGAAKMVYVGGQNGVTTDGQMARWPVTILVRKPSKRSKMYWTL